MRPDPPKVLMGIANALFLNVMPETRTPFGQTIAGMAGSLAFAVALEFDRLANRLRTCWGR